MQSDLQEVLIFAHRTNIDRYRRLLKTYLTDNERQFIEQRLGEEKKALTDIAQSATGLDCRIAAFDLPRNAA